MNLLIYILYPKILLVKNRFWVRVWTLGKIMLEFPTGLGISRGVATSSTSQRRNKYDDNIFIQQSNIILRSE